ncbi:MAG: multidrug effflux MFS transporter [Proteobacteria bacterium]|nr:multidrug effflux MFS transporter [Pseudomonadota bacterium]
MRPQNKKDLVFLILILGGIIAIGPLTIDIYLPAFNAIGADFGSSEKMLQLSLTSYFLGITFGQLLYGPIVDRFGKKLPLFLGLSLFAIASIGCYYCTNIEQMVILRFFQAIGACSGMVIPRAIVRDIFSPQESARVSSHLILVIGIAPILAPLIGNFLLEQFGWRAIFAFLGLFSLFCLLIARFAVPETKGANKREKISQTFPRYWKILRDRKFTTSALSGGLMTGGLFAYVTGSPAIYLDFFELSSRYYGLIFSLNAIGFVIASQINAYLLKKYSLEPLLRKIVILPFCIGVALIFCPANFWVMTLLFSLFLFSCGMVFPNVGASALTNQGEHSGSASALLGTIQFGLAAITSFLVSKFSEGNVTFVALVVGSCGIMSCCIQQVFKKRR